MKWKQVEHENHKGLITNKGQNYLKKIKDICKKLY